MQIVHFLGILAGSEAHAGDVMCQIGTEATQYDPSLDTMPSKEVMKSTTSVAGYLDHLGFAPLFIPFLYFSQIEEDAFRVQENRTAPRLISMRDEEQKVKVVYEQDFLDMVAQLYGSAAVGSLLAHQYGHFLDIYFTQPLPWIDLSLTTELRGDAWVGCYFGNMGGPDKFDKDGLENALQALADFPAQSSPPWAARYEAVQNGYEACDEKKEKMASVQIEGQRNCEGRSKVAYKTCLSNVPSVNSCLSSHVDECISKCRAETDFTKEQCYFLSCTVEFSPEIQNAQNVCKQWIEQERSSCGEKEKRNLLECL